MAIDFAITGKKSALTAVLFAIVCQNYQSPRAISLSNLAFSAYPREDEFVLGEGCEVQVLAVEDEV